LKTNSNREGAPLAPVSTHDLLPSERAFLGAIQELGFGRFEFVRIGRGEIVLDPWPVCVRDVKFCSTWERPDTGEDFLLKPQVSELFAYVRDVDVGEIRELEVRHGLPFSMEIELPGGRRG
jgi:hypothetical protein